MIQSDSNARVNETFIERGRKREEARESESESKNKLMSGQESEQERTSRRARACERTRNRCFTSSTKFSENAVYSDIVTTGHELNKAGYTATEVACGWAGALFEVTRPFGQE